MRMEHLKLQSESIKYAGQTTEPRFKDKLMTVEHTHALNSAAHGFYCGARWVERSWWKRILERSSGKHSQLASNYYLNKQFKGVKAETANLIRASFGLGFLDGVKYRESIGD